MCLTLVIKRTGKILRLATHIHMVAMQSAFVYAKEREYLETPFRAVITVLSPDLEGFLSYSCRVKIQSLKLCIFVKILIKFTF